MPRLWPRARAVPFRAIIIDATACTTTSDTDRDEIEATLQRYLHGRDRLDAELYASSFTPDGELIISGDRRKGRDAMRAVVAAEAALRQSMKDRGERPRTLFHL